MIFSTAVTEDPDLWLSVYVFKFCVQKFMFRSSVASSSTSPVDVLD